MGMPVRNMKGAGVSTPAFTGLYTLNNRIEANILYLAKALEPLFIALEILGAL
jgi:hypothetical protein